MWPPRIFPSLACFKGTLFVLLTSGQAIIFGRQSSMQGKMTPSFTWTRDLEFKACLPPWAMSSSAKPYNCPLSPEFRHLLISAGFRAWSDACLVWADLECRFHDGHSVALNLPCPNPQCHHIDDVCYNALSSLRCLTPDAEARPDIVEVSSMISDIMMKYLDSLSTSQLALERKLERERRRTQRYFMEANRNAVTCHHELSLLSQVTKQFSWSYLRPSLHLFLFSVFVSHVYRALKRSEEDT